MCLRKLNCKKRLDEIGNLKLIILKMITYSGVRYVFE